MKKRISLAIAGLALILGLGLTGCVERTEVISIDSARINRYTIAPQTTEIATYFTQDPKAFLEFLEVNDDFYDFLSITAITTHGNSSVSPSYMVIYAPKTDTSEPPVEYKYYLYKTASQVEYLNFYKTFDTDTYEILDTTTYYASFLTNTYCSYTITYRKEVHTRE